MASSIISLILHGEDQASGVIGGVSSALGGLGTVATGAVVAGAAVAAGAVIGIGAAALDTSSQFANATNMMQTQLGLTESAADHMGEVVENVWSDNFAGSIEEAGAAVVIVRQQMDRFGEMTNAELTTATENALRLKDAFGMELTESTNAANTLMQNFGLTSDEAFDFITSGMQSGLNASGDFLDTIGEYSNQFANAGFDADEFFGILDTGLEGGVLGTDKIADAIKEMNIILNEGGAEVEAAFSAAGLNYEQIQASVAAGDETWADYFDSIVGGLADIEDPTQRAIAQTAIFGTMAEDLGVSFTDSLSSATLGLDEMAGATASLDAQYDNWPSMWEGINRQVLMALTPIGDALLGLGQTIMPIVQSALGWFETNLVPVLASAGEKLTLFIDTFAGAIGEGDSPIAAFKAALANIVPPEVMDQLTPVIDGIQNFMTQAKLFVTEHSEELKGAIAGIGAALAVAGIATAVIAIGGAIATLVSPIGLVIAAAGLLGAAWAGNWGGIQETTATAIANITAAVESFKAMWAVFVPWFDANVVQVWAGNIDNMVVIWTLGKQNITELVDNFKLTWAAIGEWFDANVVQPWSGNIENIKIIWETGKANIEGVLDGFKLTWAALSGWFDANVVQPLSGAVTAIQDAFTSPDWSGVGQSIVDGIAGAISSGAQAIINAAAAAAQAALNAALSLLGGGGGGNSQPSGGNIPGNAQGTSDWRGGWTMVGEEGPELVNLPRGSAIHSNNDTNRLIRQGPLSPINPSNDNARPTIIFQPGSVIINDTAAMQLLLSFLEGNIQARALGAI